MQLSHCVSQNVVLQPQNNKRVFDFENELIIIVSSACCPLRFCQFWLY
jgi:hypothetical protein